MSTLLEEARVIGETMYGECKNCQKIQILKKAKTFWYCTICGMEVIGEEKKTGRQTTYKMCLTCKQYRIFDWIIDEWMCRYCGKGVECQSSEHDVKDVGILETSNGKGTDGIV